jgi:hypothetical protein
MVKKNKTKKQNKRIAAKADLFEQIFNPTYLKILGVSIFFLVFLAICIRFVKSYLHNNTDLKLLSPGEFVEQYGYTISLYGIIVTLLVTFIRFLWCSVFKELLFPQNFEKTRIKTKRRNRNRDIPRIATKDIEFKLYKGDRLWEPKEQSQFETLLDHYGVPKNDIEWNQFAKLMNTERSGVHLKFRYLALTEALQKANQKKNRHSTSVDVSSNDEGGNDILQWWLDIGLKKFDEKNNEMYVYDDKEDDYEYEYENNNYQENEDDVLQDRAKVEIDLSPKKSGVEISLEGKVLLWNIGTARVDTINLEIQCLRCCTERGISLSGTWDDQRERCVWCSKCKQLLRISIRPMLLHANNHIICHIDRSDSLNVIDVLSSSFHANCEACLTDKETVFEAIQRGRRSEKHCTACGKKMAIFAKQFAMKDLDILSGRRKKNGTIQSGSNSSNGKTKSKGKTQPKIALVKGINLPNMGACKHFKKSLKWMRFPCCGRMYPCPVCHELDGCTNASTTLATTMICGKCSEEQAFGTGKCSACSFHMGKGGRDTRQSTMSKKDRKKKAPSSTSSIKTTCNKKNRVGAIAKKNREQKKAAKQKTQ